MNLKISTGKVKSAYRGDRIPLQGTWLVPTGDIASGGSRLPSRRVIGSYRSEIANCMPIFGVCPYDLDCVRTRLRRHPQGSPRRHLPPAAHRGSSHPFPHRVSGGELGMNLARQMSRRLGRATEAETRTVADYSITATLSVMPDPRKLRLRKPQFKVLWRKE